MRFFPPERLHPHERVTLLTKAYHHHAEGSKSMGNGLMCCVSIPARHFPFAACAPHRAAACESSCHGHNRTCPPFGRRAPPLSNDQKDRQLFCASPSMGASRARTPPVFPSLHQALIRLPAEAGQAAVQTFAPSPNPFRNASQAGGPSKAPPPSALAKSSILFLSLSKRLRPSGPNEAVDGRFC